MKTFWRFGYIIFKYRKTMAKKKEINTNIEINNRKARYEYNLEDFYTAGIVLTGTEIKSIRAGKASIVDSFCYVDENNEVWLKQAYIAKYDNGSYLNHEERRTRKLLLNKKEIRHLKKISELPYMTIVPVKMFINNKGICKVTIALAKGKKSYDKRESIKERDAKREMDSKMKNTRFC